MRCQKSAVVFNNPRYKTKAQATLFIILGIVIIALISLLLYSNSKASKDTQIVSQEETLSGSVDQQYLNTLMHKCVKETVVEAQKRYGLDTKTTPPKISAYVKALLPVCLDYFRDFEKEGFTVEKGALIVSAKITADSLVTEINYPLTMSKRGVTLTFGTMSYTFPRLVTAKLNFDKPTHLVSSDGAMILDVQPGTRAYVDGVEIKDIGVKQVDRNFNGLSNSVLAGAMAYNGWPDDTVFDKPVTMTFYYNEGDIPQFIKEENLKLGYYNDALGVWIGLNTTVDAKENRLTVQTDHFSNYGTVVNCGAAKEPITQIITPVLVQEACGPCDDGKWVSDINGKFQLMRPKEANDKIFYQDKPIPKLCTGQAAGTIPIWKDISNEKQYSTKWDECGVTQCHEEKEYTFGDLKTVENNGITTDKEIYGASDQDMLVKLLIDNGALEKGTTANSMKIKKPEYFVLANDKSKCPAFVEKLATGTARYGCAEDTCPEINVCGTTAYYVYDKAEDLKGRTYYEVYFPALGDTCLAGDLPTDPSSKDASGNIDVGFTLPSTSTETPADDGTTKPAAVPNTATTIDYDLAKLDPKIKNKKHLQMKITPICYAPDECNIILPDPANPLKLTDFSQGTNKKDIDNNGIIDRKDKAAVLRFYIEVSNKALDGKADACLMGSAKIEFLGSQPMGTFNLLCDEKTKGTYDLINGKTCSQCQKAEKDQGYVWKPAQVSSVDACMKMGDGSICAESLIGKKYYVIDPTTRQAVCKKCTFPQVYTPQPVGWLVDEADCTGCKEPAVPETAEEPVPQTVQ